MRIERSTTSISWIPSDSIPGLLRLPFDRGVMHYDPPPPLTLDDVDGMRRRGEFRFANRLSAYVDVEDGQISGCGYTGGKVMGLTPVTAGPLQVMLPTIGNRDIQWQPAVSGDEVDIRPDRGRQAGLLVPQAHVAMAVPRHEAVHDLDDAQADDRGGRRRSTQALIGASPFPRHWLYDDAGRLVQKTALTRNQVWVRTAFGTHTPWGGEDEIPDVADAETAFERALADRIMQKGRRHEIRQLQPGDFLFRQGEQSTSIALVLDGMFEVRVDDTGRRACRSRHGRRRASTARGGPSHGRRSRATTDARDR